MRPETDAPPHLEKLGNGGTVPWFKQRGTPGPRKPAKINTAKISMAKPLDFFADFAIIMERTDN